VERRTPPLVGGGKQGANTSFASIIILIDRLLGCGPYGLCRPREQIDEAV